MSQAHEHHGRKRREVELLEKLKKSSSIFDFASEVIPPEKLTVTFNGKGLFLREGANQQFEFVDVHQIAIRMPTAYPKSEPDVRWLTPVFHPNVSCSGFVKLEELGLRWQPTMTLDVLCDRLWDVARLAYVNLPAASNHAAKNWFESECAFKLPIDARPLRNRSAAQPENVVSYRRLGESQKDPRCLLTQGVMFIGDEMHHAAELECGADPTCDKAITEKPAAQDEGIYFIG